ncbi:hypothetical protein [Corallococcus exiguus]|uniref:hypothetical protein n=1 Tax=Corallococcus exiguus TaxID=83462 RepID=UPI0015609D8E|nr:hypothetical protein [Corallococcus exiguus]NRD51515.1 hypothetical protein [Corallococcus exiguus]
MEELHHSVLPACQIRHGLTQFLAERPRLAALGVELALKFAHGGDDLRLRLVDEHPEVVHHLDVHRGEPVQEFRVLSVQLVWGQLAMEVLERLGRLAHARCVLEVLQLPRLGGGLFVREQAADPPAVDVAHDAHGGCSRSGDFSEIVGDDGKEDHEGLRVWQGGIPGFMC